MRRRRKRFTWFPINPTVSGLSQPEAVTWFHQTQQVVLDFETGQSAFQTAIEILPDDTLQTSDQDQGVSLRDLVEGQEYVVERIVGKVWGAAEQAPTSDDNAWKTIIVGMGIAVLPYGDDGELELAPEDYNPLRADNAQNPWMWRRTYTLWNNLVPEINTLGPTAVQNDGPEYGFVDVKSVRRVRREQRLTMCVAVDTMEILGDGDTVEFAWGYDFRVLGAMRKASNKSTFK